MDIRFIEPFVHACQGVFEDFFHEMPSPLTPYLLDRDSPQAWEISAVIGIAGDSRGTVVISFSRSVALALIQKLTGTEHTDLDDDVIDALGEVVNIIAGNAKKGLEQYRLNISLPSVIRGDNHRVAWPTGVPILGIPFQTASGDFHLSVGLENILKVNS